MAFSAKKCKATFESLTTKLFPWVSISKYFNRTSRPSWGTPDALGTDGGKLSYLLYFLICIQYAKALLFYAVTAIFS